MQEVNNEYLCNLMRRFLFNFFFVFVENYRQLKKWHEMVDLVKTECSNLHKECMLNISTNRKSSEEILISAIDY